MKNIGNWWNDRSIEMVELSDGKVYALAGWNGEEYTECWMCIGEYYTDAGEETYTLRPVYRFEVEGIDLSALEENSPEWDRAVEVVDYNIR